MSCAVAWAIACAVVCVVACAVVCAVACAVACNERTVCSLGLGYRDQPGGLLEVHLLSIWYKKRQSLVFLNIYEVNSFTEPCNTNVPSETEIECKKDREKETTRKRERNSRESEKVRARR